MSSATPVLQAFEELLTREREALKKNQVDSLLALTSEKTGLISRLKGLNASHEDQALLGRCRALNRANNSLTLMLSHRVRRDLAALGAEDPIYTASGIRPAQVSSGMRERC